LFIDILLFELKLIILPHLSNGPIGEEIQLFFAFWLYNGFCCVEKAKIGGAIDENSLDGDDETTI
jgi:hypothetical protein